MSIRKDRMPKGNSIKPFFGYISEMLSSQAQEDETLNINLLRLYGSKADIPGVERNQCFSRPATTAKSKISFPSGEDLIQLAYFINYPVFDVIAYKSIGMQINETIRLYDRMNQNFQPWYVKNHDLWRLIGGKIDVTNFNYPELVANALTEILRCYNDDCNKLTASIVQAIGWIMLDGTPVASRCTSAMKVSWLNTLSTLVHGIPVINEMVAYIANQFKILGSVYDNGQVAIAFPLYNNFSSCMVTRHPEVVRNTVISDTTPFDPNNENIDDFIGTYINRPPIVNDLSKFGQDEQLYWQWLKTGNDRFHGSIAGILKKTVDAQIKRFTAVWSDIMLDPASPILRFFTSEVPVFNGNLVLQDLRNLVACMPVYDMEKFIQKYMRYDPLPGPRLVMDNNYSIDHPEFMGRDIRGPLNSIDLSIACYSPLSVPYPVLYDKLRPETTYSWMHKTNYYEEADAHLPTGKSPWYGFTMLFASERDGYSDTRSIPKEDLDLARDIAKYNSDRHDSYQAINGVDMTAYGMEMREGPYEDVTTYSTVFPQTKFSHVDCCIQSSIDNDLNVVASLTPGNLVALYRDVWNCFSSYAIFEKESVDDYLSTLQKKIQETGSFMIPAAMKYGIFQPKTLISPTINTSDIAMCGFYLISSHEKLTQQYSPEIIGWNNYFHTALNYINSGTANAVDGADAPIWGSEALNSSNVIKDTLIFIGDGVTMSPRVAMDRSFTSSHICGSSVTYPLTFIPLSFYHKARSLEGGLKDDGHTVKSCALRADYTFDPQIIDDTLPSPDDDVDINFSLHSTIELHRRMYPIYTITPTHDKLFEIINPECMFIDNFQNIVNQATWSKILPLSLVTGMTSPPELDKQYYSIIGALKSFHSTRFNNNPFAKGGSPSKSELLQYFSEYRNNTKNSEYDKPRREDDSRGSGRNFKSKSKSKSYNKMNKTKDSKSKGYNKNGRFNDKEKSGNDSRYLPSEVDDGVPPSASGTRDSDVDTGAVKTDKPGKVDKNKKWRSNSNKRKNNDISTDKDDNDDDKTE